MSPELRASLAVAAARSEPQSCIPERTYGRGVDLIRPRVWGQIQCRHMAWTMWAASRRRGRPRGARTVRRSAVPALGGARQHVVGGPSVCVSSNRVRGQGVAQSEAQPAPRHDRHLYSNRNPQLAALNRIAAISPVSDVSYAQRHLQHRSHLVDVSTATIVSIYAPTD
jgi:hypothetical protein